MPKVIRSFIAKRNPLVIGTKSTLILRIIKEFNLGSINAWPLHLRGNTKKVFYNFLEAHFAHLLPKYRMLYQNGNVSKEYASDLHSRVTALRHKYQSFAEYEPTKPVNKKDIQMSLFD